MLRSHDDDVDADDNDHDNDDDDYGDMIMAMTAKKNCLARPSKKCPKCMLLGTSGVILGDLGTFWSDFRDFIMQNHSVL